ncbi:MAG: hypothetical protein J2P46_00570 [Zavarzinella sp.]|nr:hypothetical protein [Zavarzinella sp.]
MPAIVRPLFAMAALFALLAAAPAARAAFLIEGFDYQNGLNGQNGGTGFAGPWTAAAANATVSDGAAKLTGNNDNAASRSLAAAVNSTVYFSFTVQFVGSLDADDFFALWFDSSTSTNHGGVPNVGIRGNGSADFYVRLSQPPNGTFFSQNLVSGETYTIVGRLGKSGGAGSAFDSITLWVNPASEASGSVTATTPGTTLTSFNAIGFRTANLDAGDTVFVDNVRLGNSFDSVVTPAPPAVILGAFGGALLLGGHWFRRATTPAKSA